MKLLKCLFVTTIIFASVSTFATLPTPSPTQESLNNVVAVVNDEVITQNDLNTGMEQAREQLAAVPHSHAIDNSKLRDMVLQNLIDQKLQVELASRAKVSVTSEEVSQAIDNLAKMNHVTVAQLKEKLAGEHIPFDRYRGMIHQQLLIHKVQQNMVSSSIRITQASLDKVKTMYQAQANQARQFHVIDFVLPTEAQAKAVTLALKNGHALSKTESEDKHDLGWKSVNDLPTLFTQQLTQMSPGDVAGPIQAPNGYHVLQLVSARGNMPSLTDTQLQTYAYNMEMQQAVTKWLKKLRETAYIKIVDA